MAASRAADVLFDESLVVELHRLGVEHLVSLAALPPLPVLPDGAALISALADHPQSRFRSALILLFLRRPDYSYFVAPALVHLDVPAGNALRLYYQAAVYLRPELDGVLRLADPTIGPLPDLFSSALQLPAPGALPADNALRLLGDLHARLTGRALNWAASYRHHLPLFRRQLQRHAQPAGTA